MSLSLGIRHTCPVTQFLSSSNDKDDEMIHPRLHVSANIGVEGRKQVPEVKEGRTTLTSVCILISESAQVAISFIVPQLCTDPR